MKKITLVLILLAYINSFGQVTNDIPCSATDLIVDPIGCNNSVYSFDDTETDSSGFADPSCLFSRNAIEDRWYRFVMPSNGKAVRIVTSYLASDPFNPFDDPAIEVFSVANNSDPCNNLVSFDCNDDGNPDTTSSQFFTQIDIIEPADSIIYFRIWHNNGDNIGDFNMCLYEIDSPIVATNDECTNPIVLPLTVDCSSSVLSTNFQATASSETDPSCAANDGDDVWFQINVKNDKFYDIVIETFEDQGSNVFDTGIAVYSGTCGSLTEIACNDDIGNGNLFSRIDDDNDLKGLKGEILYVRVFPVQIGQTGTFFICATETETLDIEENNWSSLSIYPNPAKDILNLKFNQISNNEIDINIYNIQGKLILKNNQMIRNNSTQIDVSTLKSGMYFLKINDGIRELTNKLIIE